MDVSPTIQHLHGRIRSITGANPEVGAEISEAVPTRRHWIIYAIRFVFVTDDTEISRRVELTIDNGSSIIISLMPVSFQLKNLTYTYNYANFSTFRDVSQLSVINPLPPLPLLADYRIRTSTGSIQAGDNYSAPQLLVEEWIDP